MLENEKALNEIDDDELNEVAGGGTYTKDGFLKTVGDYFCGEFECRDCGSRASNHCHNDRGFGNICKCCRNCKWHTILRCGNPINKR